MGDVEGKGLSAALVMASVHSLMRASASARLAPSTVCSTVNDELCKRTAAGRFVSFFYCTYDVTRRRLVYANAGHLPPCLVHSDGTTSWLAPCGPVLGVFPDGRFEQVEIQLNTGDRLVLFTDGITEAQDQEGGEFGEERLLRLALQTRHMSARDVQRTILDAARAFAGGTFADDATLIVMVTNRFGN
jgi:sigma-B regulation protein RsbU (phosphoserine phosphatase)